MNGRAWLIILFAGGFMVGKNWAKIRKVAGPNMAVLEEVAEKGFNDILRFAVEQKERIEDSIAASRIKKTKGKKANRKKIAKTDLKVVPIGRTSSGKRKAKKSKFSKLGEIG